MAGRVIDAAPDDAALAILKRTWSVPILAIARAPTRYSAIKTKLGKITDRALSQSLFFLEERDWLARDINVSHRAAYPTYRAIEKGAEISRLIHI